MAELYGVNLATHLDSILTEFKARKSIYGHPQRKTYLGFPGMDLGVDFHGRRAETVLGPASGPHTQMAQNIVLSFLGGGRIMELKTVQILDQLDIPRPCIDVRNIGFNVEWSQELRLQESFHEYVNAWMLLKFMEELEILSVPKGHGFYDTVFDISVGYDLKGIQSPQMHTWLEEFKHAEAAIAEKLDELPARYAHLKKTRIDPNISDSVTLSTFHGCPAHEIEAIVKHLIQKHAFHVIVKMNPTILGYERVKSLLYENLGFGHIELDPAAFEHDISFDEAVAVMKRLQNFAASHNVNVGAKFTNTLVVKNNQDVFSDEVMYLSGAPLHVLAMTAMHEFRKEMGAGFHVSFSAGITKHNFVDAVMCNMKPVTTCTDLLKEGGYTRLFDYLRRLQRALQDAGCSTVPDFIRSHTKATSLEQAGVENAERIVPYLPENPIYHYNSNHKTPPKIDSHLELFDCITCNKCLPVCPNASNFSIATGTVDMPMQHYDVVDGKFIARNGDRLMLKKKNQIANLADFCNECGDCDTYCPEFGGPFIEKPRFFFSEKTYQKYSSYDGFYFPSSARMQGRIDGKEYSLSYDDSSDEYVWYAADVHLRLSSENELIEGNVLTDHAGNLQVDTTPFYIMRVLFDGIRNDADNYPAIMLLES